MLRTGDGTPDKVSASKPACACVRVPLVLEASKIGGRNEK